MTRKVHISDKERGLVIKGLKMHFPQAKFYVFGSRVSGSPKKYSDLDIAIDDGGPIPLAKIAGLKEFFSQSPLPFIVDISDFHLMDKEFQERVLSEQEQW